MSNASNAPGMLASPDAPTGAVVRAQRAGYAACIWALAFAAASFYWAAGGTAGAETIGPALAGLALARDPEFVAILWITGALKAVAGLLALALTGARPGRLPVPLPRWMLLLAGWAAAAGLILYGGASFVQHALMVAGAVAIPAGLGATGARWHLLLWDPWWLLGGTLFAIAAWGYGRRTACGGRYGELGGRGGSRRVAQEADR